MGASVCTIEASFVLNNEFKIHKAPSKLEGFGKKVVQSIGYIEEELILDNLQPMIM